MLHIILLWSARLHHYKSGCMKNGGKNNKLGKKQRIRGRRMCVAGVRFNSLARLLRFNLKKKQSWLSLSGAFVAGARA
jgi:hypothetical protein